MAQSSTMLFNSEELKRENMKQLLKSVSESLNERGYNSVNQIAGYLMSNDPAYISSYKNARTDIQQVERYEIIEELVRYYLESKQGSLMDNKIYIIDDQGREVEMNILFTFENNDKKYCVVYENSNEDELYAFYYDDEGNIFTVDDPEELEMVNEVVSAFDEQEEEDEEDA